MIEVALRRLLMGPVAPLLLLALALAGCGPQPTEQPTEPTVPATPTSAPAGAVSVTTDATRYRMGSTVEVTVVNNGSAPVFTQDQKSDCTVVTLQAQRGTEWIGFSTCGAERAPRTVRLAAGERLVARIDLGSENFRPQPVTPGAYRVVFTFGLEPSPSGAEPEMAASGIFQIE